MIRPEFKHTLLEQHGAAVILWGFFTVSIFLYVVIAQTVIASRGVPTTGQTAQIVRLVLWLLVFVDLGYLVWWKKRRLNRAAIERESGATRTLRALAEPKNPSEKNAAALVSTYITRKIVSFAIVEAIAVYGLVAALVGGFVLDQLALSALSLALLAADFPAKHYLEQLVRDCESSARAASSRPAPERR